MNTSPVIKNRYEFTFLVEAQHCNPNGDPDMGNLPRQDMGDGKGYISHVAIKRKIRDYILDAFAGQQGMEILMQPKASVNKYIAEASLEAQSQAKDSEKKAKDPAKTSGTVQKAGELITEKFWDVRTFGGVLTTGMNAGQIQGPVQIGNAYSVDPIEPESIRIDRVCYADGKDFKTVEEYEQEEEIRPDDSKRTFGTQEFIPYGLYVVQGTISPYLAEKTGFSEDDLKTLFEAIMQMYNHNISSSKIGMSVISPLIIFKHVGTQSTDNEQQNAREAMSGCAPAHKLFDLLEVHKKEEVEFPRAYSDYDVTLNLSKLPKGVEAGLKTDFYGEIDWNPVIGSEIDGVKII